MNTMIFVGILLCASALIMWGFYTYSSLIKSKVIISEAWSTIDIFLKKRGLKISELLHVIKNTLAVQDGTVVEMSRLQHAATIAMSIPEKSDAELKISTLLKSLLNEISSKPELKQVEQITDLIQQINELDGEIQRARAHYNSATRNYNIIVHTIPSALIAKLMAFESQPYFENV